jgi:hypothetical protein
MRLFAALLLQVAGCLQAQQGSVAGTVVDQTGKPLAGVHIRLVAGEFAPGGRVSAVYGVDSDDAGHFSASDLKAGVYTLFAERAGYVQQETKGAPLLAVKLGQPTDYRLVMGSGSRSRAA